MTCFNVIQERIAKAGVECWDKMGGLEAIGADFEDLGFGSKACLDEREQTEWEVWWSNPATDKPKILPQNPLPEEDWFVEESDTLTDDIDEIGV